MEADKSTKIVWRHHGSMSVHSVLCALPFQDCPEFDLVFDSSVDQWVASSSAEKCIFVQILYHACQNYWEGKGGPLVKQSPQGRLSRGAHRDAGAGPTDSSPGPAPRTLQARRKSYVPPKHTEFINCQSKLTRGT